MHIFPIDELDTGFFKADPQHVHFASSVRLKQMLPKSVRLLVQHKRRWKTHLSENAQQIRVWTDQLLDLGTWLSKVLITIQIKEHRLNIGRTYRVALISIWNNSFVFELRLHVMCPYWSQGMYFEVLRHNFKKYAYFCQSWLSTSNFRRVEEQWENAMIKINDNDEVTRIMMLLVIQNLYL